MDILIRYKISYFKIFNYKTYILIKKPYTLARIEKLKLKIFISYLVHYNLINSFCIWNPDNSKIKGYKDIIISKNEFLIIYKRTKLIKVIKKDTISILILELYIFKIDKKDKKFLNTLVRNR